MAELRNTAYPCCLKKQKHGKKGPLADLKRVLLIDLGDRRRDTRIMLLKGAGYQVEVREDYIAAETLDDEGEFDLVVLALHIIGERMAIDYMLRLHEAHPNLPILLLTDAGYFRRIRSKAIQE